MFCNNCGALVEEGTAFCPSCGQAPGQEAQAQQAYTPAPAYVPPPPPPSGGTNNAQSMSIAALVCGILGIIGAFIPVVCFFTLVLAILGVVFGIKARKLAQAGQSGMATAGLVLGIIGLAFAAVGAICYICVLGTLCAAGGAIGSAGFPLP